MTSPVFDPTGTHTLQLLAQADKLNKWMYQTISPYLKGEILEIGSGIANISGFALKENKTITLSDINPEYRQQLTELFSGQPTLRGVLNIDLQHTDFKTKYLSLESRYDSIFMLNVIEHLADDQAAIENCRFLLKDGGHLVVLAPSYQWLYCRLDQELGHYRRYTTSTLARLFPTTQFTIIRKRYFNAAGITGWLVFGKLLQRKRLARTETKIYNRLVPLFRIVDQLLFHKFGLSSVIIAKTIK